MTRQQALVIAARIMGNMMSVRKDKSNAMRTWRSDLNYLADCLMEAAAGQTDEMIYHKV